MKKLCQDCFYISDMTLAHWISTIDDPNAAEKDKAYAKQRLQAEQF